MKKLLRYLVNTILFIVLWGIQATIVIGFSFAEVGARPSGSIAIGGIVALIISFAIVKRINKSKLWSRLFDETEVVNDVVEEKNVEVEEEKIEKKVEVEDANSDKQFQKGMDKLVKKTFIILVIIIPLSFLGIYINDYLQDKKYCNSERYDSEDRTFDDVSDNRKPDFRRVVELKYSEGRLYYKAMIYDTNPQKEVSWMYKVRKGGRNITYKNNKAGRVVVTPDQLDDWIALESSASWKRDSMSYEKIGTKKSNKDITKTHIYKTIRRASNLSFDVELLDKDGFLLKDFTINNFELDEELVSPGFYFEGYYNKYLVAKGSFEMPHSLFKKISCYKRSCSDCDERSREPYKSMNISNISY